MNVKNDDLKPDDKSRDDEYELVLPVRRSDMAVLSEYFGRDARRYDRGFELY